MLKANGLWCNTRCAAIGPYCGRAVRDENRAQFIKEGFLLNYSPDFINRLYRHFKDNLRVRIPKVWPDIKSATQHLVASGAVRAVMLTGSLVCRDYGHKDYDLVLLVDRFEYALEPVFQKALPRSINGIPCDYFYTEKTDGSLFTVALDCDAKVLYTSVWFDAEFSNVEDDIEIKNCGSTTASRYMDVSALARQNVPVDV